MKRFSRQNAIPAAVATQASHNVISHDTKALIASGVSENTLTLNGRYWQ